jgi:purine-binding chemotaxis protein CheW
MNAYDGEGAILRERARILAVVPEAAPEAGALIQVLRFSLAEELYAIENRYLREVLPLPRITPLPCVPAFVQGIINVRGRMVCLLDLKSIFGLSETTIGPTSCAIILQSPGREFGLLADEIMGLAPIPVSSLQASLPTLTDIRARYLKGVTAEGLVLLDAGKIFADKNLVIDESVGSTG